MAAEPFVGGLRLGSLVELHGDGLPLAGQLGQLVSYSRTAGVFNVTLLSGEVASLEPRFVRAPLEVKKPGAGGGPLSFDILLGPRTPDVNLAEELGMCLFEKGFCVLKLCQSQKGLPGTLEAVRALGHAGRLGRLPEEVEEGYLGTGGRGKVLWLDRDAPAVDDEVLESSDQTLSYLASLLQPFSMDAVGKYIDERTPALVSLSLQDEEEDDYPQPVADDKTLGDFLGTWRRGAVRVVHFMGPPAAEVTLESRGGEAASALPCEQESVSLSATPNTILIFRTDCYTHEWKAEAELLTMMASFLAPGPVFALSALEADARALLASFALGPPPPAHEVVSVLHHHCRFPARWDAGEMLNSGLQGGTDTVVEIPQVRFDLSIYWCPDPSELLSGPPRTVQRHTSFVDGIDLFDNRYFEISNNETLGMDPLQRQVLDVGGNLIFQYGITKKDSNRSSHHAGCAVGVDKDDYPTLPNAAQGGGCNAYAIIANRFSFVFNLKGPNYVCDTACSASLTASHVAKLMLLDRNDNLEFHLALGTHLCLSPAPWIGCSFSQMVSPEGRCFTFNASANGYLRGEGTSGIFLKLGAESDRQAAFRSSSVGQDGRSASLTAPNGPAQEEIISRAVREAKMTPPESTCWECHGTGTSLGDPIEIGAVRKIQIKMPREEPLMMGTAKSNIGHLEGGAAMGGIVKCVLEVMHAQCVSSQHLRQLNPHLEHAAFDAFFESELSPFAHEQGHAQVSSFGFGGSNGHGVFWGREIDSYHDLNDQLMQKIAKMRPPEVRPIGDNPDNWESDWPDDPKPGERWTLSLTGGDPREASITFVKDVAVQEDDEDDAPHSITGNFNEWDEDRMAAGTVPGQHVASVAVPESGVLEFRFLKDGDREQAIGPESAACAKKNARIVGPGKEVKTSWVVRAEPNTEYQIELFHLGGKYSVLWFKA